MWYVSTKKLCHCFEIRVVDVICYMNNAIEVEGHPETSTAIVYQWGNPLNHHLQSPKFPKAETKYS